MLQRRELEGFSRVREYDGRGGLGGAHTTAGTWHNHGSVDGNCRWNDALEVGPRSPSVRKGAPAGPGVGEQRRAQAKEHHVRETCHGGDGGHGRSWRGHGELKHKINKFNVADRPDR